MWWRMGAVFGMVLVSACIEAQLQPCGDKLCPADGVCLAPGVCATRAAVEACAGLDERAPCATTVFDGSCVSGACSAARCGDGYVSGAEQCDGPVTDVDCVAYGFDLGVPLCNERCDIDLINSCQRFGWRREDATPMRAAWVDGGSVLAFVRAVDRVAEVHWGSQVFVEPRPGWDEVTGGGSTVVAWTLDDIIRSTGGAWEPVDTPPFPMLHVVVAPDGTLYASSLGATCQVARRAPEVAGWEQILAVAGDCGDLEIDGSAVLLGLSTGPVMRFSGTWQTLFDTARSVTAVLHHGPLYYAGAEGQGLVVWDGTQQRDVFDPNGTIEELVSSGPYVYFDNRSGNYGRLDGTLVERFAAPIFGKLLVDPTGALRLFGNGLYRYTGTIFGTHDSLDAVTTDLTLLRDGNIAGATLDSLLLRTNDSQWRPQYPSINVISIAGRSIDDVFFTDGTELHHFDGISLTTALAPPFPIHDLWATASGEPSLLAVGADARLLAMAGGTWTTEAAPAGSSSCELTSLGGIDTELYAVGACGAVGIVWMRTGTGVWTEVYRGGGPLQSVTRTTDGAIFAAGPTGGAATTDGVWGPTPEARGVSISATTANDVFVAGGPDDVVHWDGLAWSRLHVSGAVTPRVQATPNAVYIAGTAESVLLR